MTDINTFIDPRDFAALGGGQVAYVKEMTSDDVRRAFPMASEIPANMQFFALLNADGSPILLTDTREAALANAIANDLQPVSLH